MDFPTLPIESDLNLAELSLIDRRLHEMGRRERLTFDWSNSNSSRFICCFRGSPLIVKMAAIHVGAPPNEWESLESRLVKFHRFQELSCEKGRRTVSPKFRWFGHEWRVLIYPGGDHSSRDCMVGLFLEPCSGPHISVKFKHTFLIRKDCGEKVVFCQAKTQCLQRHGDGRTFHRLQKSWMSPMKF